MQLTIPQSPSEFRKQFITLLDKVGTPLNIVAPLTWEDNESEETDVGILYQIYLQHAPKHITDPKEWWEETMELIADYFKYPDYIEKIIDILDEESL